MLRKGTVDLPLHRGKCPTWLFEKMVKLSRAILIILVEEFGPKELLRRLSDPFWFQAFGCLLGFDWHSSGLTTTVGGAIKRALAPMFKDLGLFVCGGKGKQALQTPSEIRSFAEANGLASQIEGLVTLSRLVARIDNNAIQDGFQLYFHLFLFTADGNWAVVQQGMDENSLYARRYHWLSDGLASLTRDPHKGIISSVRREEVLNLVAPESWLVQEAMVRLLQEPLVKVLKEVKASKHHVFPAHHEIRVQALPSEVLPKIWLKTYENPPQSFTELLLVQGLGAKALRALTLTAELIYDVSASRKDPVHFAFAHGGKDGYPYRINQKLYQKSLEELERIIERIRVGDRERLAFLRRLPTLFNKNL